MIRTCELETYEFSIAFFKSDSVVVLAAPEDLKVAGKTVNSISVTWTRADGDEKHYRVNCFAETDGVPSDSVNGTDDSPEATCKGLMQGTLYNIKIATVKPGFIMESCGNECWLTNVTGS